MRIPLNASSPSVIDENVWFPMFRIDRSIKLQFYRFLRDISHRYRCAVDIRRPGAFRATFCDYRVYRVTMLLVSSNYFFYSGWLRDDLKTNETVGRLENDGFDVSRPRTRFLPLRNTFGEHRVPTRRLVNHVGHPLLLLFLVPTFSRVLSEVPFRVDVSDLISY